MPAPQLPAQWREIEVDAPIPEGSEFLHYAAGPTGPFRQWVKPAPKTLPDPIGTSIMVTAGTERVNAGEKWVRGSVGWHIEGSSVYVSVTDLQECVTDFEIIAMPPAATATEVLAAIVATGVPNPEDLQRIATQFGATLPETIE